MVTIVDVELKKGTFDLLINFILEGRTKSEGRPKDLAIEEGINKFLQILKGVIQRKLGYPFKEYTENYLITSETLILEGQGSIEIGEKPTEAQIQLINSLFRVIFHQAENQKEEFYLNEGSNNLILSIFVKKMTGEVQPDNLEKISNVRYENSGLDKCLFSILNGNNLNVMEETLSREGLFRTNFYILEEPSSLSNDDTLTEEFTRIGLNETNLSGEDTELEESPFIINSNFPQNLFSSQTQKLVTITQLPSPNFEGLWESLYFGNDVKSRLYNYAELATTLGEFLKPQFDKTQGFSKVLINNKLFLLHGPPGTGKTTLCRSLCQKIIIRKQHLTFSYLLKPDCRGILVELSCARIFSRWFGESSKNLEVIFTDLKKILSSAENQYISVFVLIDEVETIAGSRKDILSKNESSDSIRVVNTLLTQLDSLKQYKNLLILSTSNLLESLEPAFLDRVDGIFFVGKPSVDSISNILISIIETLLDSGVVFSRNRTKKISENEHFKSIEVLSRECIVCFYFYFKIWFPYNLLTFVYFKEIRIEWKNTQKITSLSHLRKF